MTPKGRAIAAIFVGFVLLALEYFFVYNVTDGPVLAYFLQIPYDASPLASQAQKNWAFGWLLVDFVAIAGVVCAIGPRD